MSHAALLSRRHPLQISPPQFRGSCQCVGSLVSYKFSLVHTWRSRGVLSRSYVHRHGRRGTSGPYVGRVGPNGCLPNRLHDGGRAPAPARACTCAGTRARICTNRTATVPASAVTSPGALGRPLACCGACGARSRCNGARRAHGTCCARRSYRARLACRCSGCFEWKRRRRRRRFAPRPV
jgi:hypothetical protein